MVVNGVELEDLDIFDVDIAVKYENALEKVAKESHVDENLKGSEIIRNQCQIIFDCFNELFGEGTDKKVFGEKVNVITCLKAFEQLIEETNKQSSKLKELQLKYSPNRVKRRSKK